MEDETGKNTPRNRQLRRGYIIVVLRLCLGAVFFYAALSKLRNINAFSYSIANYEILPYWIVNAAALFLPWLELWTGVFLILGVFVRACAALQGGLLVAFILAIAAGMIRGTELSCGCFGDHTGMTGYGHLIFDGLCFLIAGALFILERRRFSHRLPIFRLFSRPEQETKHWISEERKAVSARQKTNLLAHFPNPSRPSPPLCQKKHKP